MQQAMLKSTSPSLIASKTTSLNWDGSQHKTHDELLLLATGRFCGLDNHNRLTIEQYKEAFYLLIGTVSVATKQKVAGTLAQNASTPRTIALFFAMEDISIAAPFIKRSDVLNQLDMIHVVSAAGLEHAKLLAAREKLGPSIKNHLRSLKDPQIDQLLDKTQAISRSKSEQSSVSLFDEIEKTKDVEPDVALATVADANQPFLNDATKSLVAAAARGGRTSVSDQEDSNDWRAKVPTNEIGHALEKAACHGGHQAIGTLLTKYLGIDFPTAQQVLDDKSGDTLSVAMMSCGLDTAQANRILMLAFPEIGLSVHNAKRAVRYYAALTQVACQEAIAQWPKIQPSKAQHLPYMTETRGGRYTPRENETILSATESVIQQRLNF